MAFKETPTNIRVYYKSMRTKYTLLKEEALNLKDTIEDELKQLHINVLNYVEENYGASFKAKVSVDI